MLSILPFDRLAKPAPERAFKSYPRPPTTSPAPYYPGFTPPAYSSTPTSYSSAPGLSTSSRRSLEGMELQHPHHKQADMYHPHPQQHLDLGGSHHPHHQSMMPSHVKQESHELAMSSMGSMGSMGAMSMAYSMGHHLGHSAAGGYPPHTTANGMEYPLGGATGMGTSSPPLNLGNKNLVNTTTSAAASSTSTTSSDGDADSSNPGDSVHMPSKSSMPPKKRALSVPEDLKDDTYWDKRKKNNDSAKRSREARRMKEEQIAMRVVYLEQENLQLRTEVSLLKGEIEKLRCMLYNA